MTVAVSPDILTPEAVLKHIRRIARNHPRYGTYDLARGNAFEQMVVELFREQGIESGRYYQSFPPERGDLIRANQIDLWVRGGTSRKIYQLETKTRSAPDGRNLFDYPDILVGGCRTWDEKNQAIATKKGRKPVLAIVIVCENTGNIKVTSCLPEDQVNWMRGSRGKEPSYLVKTSDFMDFVDFIDYIRTI